MEKRGDNMTFEEAMNTIKRLDGTEMTDEQYYEYVCAQNELTRLILDDKYIMISSRKFAVISILLDSLESIKGIIVKWINMPNEDKVGPEEHKLLCSIRDEIAKSVMVIARFEAKYKDEE